LWVCDVSDPDNPLTVTRINPGIYAKRVVASGNYLYLLSGTLVSIFDVSDPTQPRSAGQSDLGPATFSDLAVAGNYVYAPHGSHGLEIFLLVPQLSISPMDPSELTVSWSAPPAGGWSLQRSTDPISTNWLAVTNTQVLSSNRVQVLLPRTGASQFFRLKYQ
jgi:hypothetical protein